MGKETVEALIEAGKASAGPPIGNKLGPLKVNVGKIVSEINEKTKNLAGMQVPVKITVDTDTKEYEIVVGTPPVAALIKRELGLEKGSSEPGKTRAGDLTEEQVRKIAKAKFGSDEEVFLKQVMGTCKSMGVTIGMGAVTEEERKKGAEERERMKEEAEKKAEKAEEGKKEAGKETAESQQNE